MWNPLTPDILQVLLPDGAARTVGRQVLVTKLEVPPLSDTQQADWDGVLSAFAIDPGDVMNLHAERPVDAEPAETIARQWLASLDVDTRESRCFALACTGAAPKNLSKPGRT